MREWLSGRASPCQGERREFESRLPLHKNPKLIMFWVFFMFLIIKLLLIMNRICIKEIFFENLFET